eukprot:CAMPEP_0194032948 /NCGR_PEP_ID=MMETSP0009_2-20130614/5778_1 /TAXON_ID=210454 /ORGANISM="Grammatophora oceanica, Strain CCMP 410" /LENGTH=363 /DNA_ID=CAMNT_0038673537 /DNA_START=92 /DNA_END=1183 /DNA_ORIENTATION=+
MSSETANGCSRLKRYKSRNLRVSVQTISEEPKERAAGVAVGTAVVGVVMGLKKGALFTAVKSLTYAKKGVLMALVKKKAFLRIGSLTTVRKAAAVDPKKATWRDVCKSIVLGLTVFGTYELIAYHLLAGVDESDMTKYLSITLGKMTDDSDTVEWRLHKSGHATAAEQSSVLSHVGAGLCSGLAQSMVQVAWEQSIVRDTPHSWRYIQGRALHHSIGYASLFGTYEALRRSMTKAVHDGFVMVGHEDPNLLVQTRLWLGPQYEWIIRREDGVYDVTPVSLVTSFLAGGLAGQVHHVVSHYSRCWLFGQPSALQLRPLLASFGPTSIIFLAFQFGGELSERILGEAFGEVELPERMAGESAAHT